MLGHSHLNQDSPKLIVGRLNVFEIRLADRLANNRRDFGVAEIALSQQFPGLLALEVGVQERVRRCGSDVASGDHGKF